MQRMAIWIDHDEAKIFHAHGDTFDEATLHSANHHVHRHPKDQETKTRNHPDDEHQFFHEVARALAGAEQILVVGPSMTKLHFLRYVQKHDVARESRIVGIETSDHPTDGQLVAHLRQYFHSPAARRAVDS